MFKQLFLSSGLRLIISPLTGTKSISVLVLVGAGSRYEKKETNGISHFLEHMFFKGAKKYKNAEEVASRIDGIGGEFNAFTGKEYAGYYVKVASNHGETAMDVLSDMMLHSTFKNEEINKERHVILEEYNMYQDTPMYQVGWDFEKLLFGDQPLGWDQIGTLEFLKNANHNDFVFYKNALYTADNTVISIAGNSEFLKNGENIKSKINRFFQFNNKKKEYGFAPYKILGTNKNRIFIQHKKTEQAHLVLGTSAPETTHKDHFAVKVLAILLGGNMSSRMFLNVREKYGLAYYIQTTTDDYVDTGAISTRAGVDLKRADQAITAIKDEYLHIAKEKIEENELKKAKEYMKGKIILSMEDSEEMAHFLGKQALLYNKILTLDEVIAKIDDVTRDDIYRISNELFKQNNFRLAVIGPFDDNIRFEKLLN